MKNTLLKYALLAPSLLVAGGYADLASAHTQNGSLGRSDTATDVYAVTCSNDGNGEPDRLIASVRDEKPRRRPTVTVAVSKNDVSTNTTDPRDGDRLYSPAVELLQGPGDYSVTVSKSGLGAEIYKLQFHCMSGINHVATDILRTQNQ